MTKKNERDCERHKGQARNQKVQTQNTAKKNARERKECKGKAIKKTKVQMDASRRK